MENLEEVLQALDEFQKMRPTEIPRELEDYLCWVAKTGDPVYQWSMIKTLFREKLTRVMTDFYESCPTLELAPCPNVEHFNYDTMKSNLLERLESFANAPFTVQRICELLTAPRKEYNRVDKFMRAIEKNILVVSTREPGPVARRGETGDGMVNGSVEEDAAAVTQQQQPPPPSPPPSSQQQQQQPPQPAQTSQLGSQDVEMEYWEKDCASTVTISVHTVPENESSLLHTVVSSGSALVKSTPVFAADEGAREKLEQAASRTDAQLAASNFISATSDFSAISNLTSQVEQPQHESPISPAVPVVQSLQTPVAMVTEDGHSPAADVAEAILNEDSRATSRSTLEHEEMEVTTSTSTTTTTTTTAAAATTTITMTTTTITMTTTTTTTTTTSTSTSTSTAPTTVTVVATVIPLTTDTTRKLHAALHAKRFESGKCPASDKPGEKTSVGAEDGVVRSTAKSVLDRASPPMSKTSPSMECVDSNGMPRDESRLTTEDLLKTDVDMRSENSLAENAASVIEERTPSRGPEEEDEEEEEEEEGGTSLLEDMDEEESPREPKIGEPTKAMFVEARAARKDDAVAATSADYVSAVIVSSGEALHRMEKAVDAEETIPPSAEIQRRDQPTAVVGRRVSAVDTAEVADKAPESIPTLTSTGSDDHGQDVPGTEFNADSPRMMEVTSDESATLVAEPTTTSEPTRIVESSRETSVAVLKKLDPVSPEMTENMDAEDSSATSNVICESPRDRNKLTSVDDKDTPACIADETGKQPTVIESVACRREHEPMELMDVDDEESTSTYQQDEQMEQETTEKQLSKS